MWSFASNIFFSILKQKRDSTKRIPKNDGKKSYAKV
jgi:hypothetical protein